MNYDNFLEKNFPNFYYHEVVFNKVNVACTRCGFMFFIKDLSDGFCVRCKALPVINHNKEKFLFGIVTIFLLIVIVFLLSLY